MTTFHLGKNTHFWEINITQKTAEFIICVQNLWICAINEEILKNVMKISARNSQYLQWPLNNKPLNTFGTLELLFPISKKEFVLVLYQFPNMIVRYFLLHSKMHPIDMILFVHGIATSGASLCFVYIQHIRYLANHRMVSYSLNSIFKLK